MYINFSHLLTEMIEVVGIMGDVGITVVGRRDGRGWEAVGILRG